MNNIFNMSRFGRLFIKHSAEHYKSYLMSLIVLTGVLLLGGSFITFLLPGGFIDVNMQRAIFIILLFLAGTMFTSTVFADLGDKKKAIPALTLPASTLEKYTVGWLYSFLIYQVLFTGVYYLILMILSKLKLEHVPGQVVEIFNVFEIPHWYQIYLLFALLHAVALYGAIFFDKLHFIKSAFVFFIFIGALIVLNRLIQGWMVNADVLTQTPFSQLRFIENKKVMTIGIAQNQVDFVEYMIALLTLMFWMAAYYRLKEKQV